MGVMYDANGHGIDKNNPLPTSQEESKIIQPVDIQARYSKTIQTHAGVSVAPSSGAFSPFFECDGFDKIAFTLLNNATGDTELEVKWSNDKALDHGAEKIITGTGVQQAVEVGIKAPYFRIYVANKDTTIPHTLSAWAYLKA